MDRRISSNTHMTRRMQAYHTLMQYSLFLIRLYRAAEQRRSAAEQKKNRLK